MEPAGRPDLRREAQNAPAAGCRAIPIPRTDCTLLQCGYRRLTMLKRITLRADEALVQRAQRRALREGTTLNALFREWLARYVGRDRAGRDYDRLMERLSGVRAGRCFTRDEMNE